MERYINPNVPMRKSGGNMRILTAMVIVVALAVLAPCQDRQARKPFTIAISAGSSATKAGSSVDINIRLTNNSSEPLDCSGSFYDLTGQDSNFIYEVRDEHGRMVSKRAYPHPELAAGKAILGRTIRPGESITESQDVGRIYDMTKPGKYVIQVSRPVSFTNQKAGVVKSNKATITVAP
ncbi:MAG: hypothetical protein WB763_09360 [Terriglobia bacterium]|jgi:hypothetical protein